MFELAEELMMGHSNETIGWHKLKFGDPG